MVRPLGWEVKGHISILTLPWPSPWGPAFFEPVSPQLDLKGDRLLEPFESQTQAVFSSSSSIFLSLNGFFRIGKTEPSSLGTHTLSPSR